MYSCFTDQQPTSPRERRFPLLLAAQRERILLREQIEPAAVTSGRQRILNRLKRQFKGSERLLSLNMKVEQTEERRGDETGPLSFLFSNNNGSFKS